MIQLAPLLLLLALLYLVAAQEAASSITTTPTPAATLKYYVFTEECFEAFFGRNEWLHVECLKRVQAG